MLFGSIVFGPITSRRLGISLGINLLPSIGKVCSFDCIYCECGYNKDHKGGVLPTRQEVKDQLQETLAQMYKDEKQLDVITFAGNGEPTMHPQFAAIVADTIALRNLYYPNVKISVLSNATQLGNTQVVAALHTVDNNIQKLDSAVQQTAEAMCMPNSTSYSVEQVIEQLAAFEGDVIVQTMFLRGEHNGISIDNTTPYELEQWILALQKIAPRQVMIYSIDRPTPEKNLHQISKEELTQIAEQARSVGFQVSVA